MACILQRHGLAPSITLRHDSRTGSSLLRARQPRPTTPQQTIVHAPLQRDTWRSRSCPRSTAQAEAPTRLSSLTTELQDMEAELERMFERRPLPKAAVVNQAREKIASLKAELADLVNGVATPSPAAMAKQAAEIELENAAIEKARLLLDGVKRRRKPGWTPVSDAELSIHLAVLESENDRLRKLALVLLQRQQLLEELTAKLPELKR